MTTRPVRATNVGAWFVLCALGFSPSASAQAVRTPATADEAAKVLDLTGMSPVTGAGPILRRGRFVMEYKVDGAVKDVFEFHRRWFRDAKWTETPFTDVFDMAAGATFVRDGYVVRLDVMKGTGRGGLLVVIENRGNVNLAALPSLSNTVRADTDVTDAIHYTSRDPERVREMVDLILVKLQGWVRSGRTGRIQYYRKNDVRLNFIQPVRSEPGGRTTFGYTASLVDVDLPCPPDAEIAQYDEQIGRLEIEAVDRVDEYLSHYRRTLPSRGWRAVDPPVRPAEGAKLFYRNKEGESLAVGVRSFMDRDRIWLTRVAAAKTVEARRRDKPSPPVDGTKAGDAPRLACSCCGMVTRVELPPGVPTGPFGPRQRETLAMFAGAYRLAKRPIQQLAKDLFGLDVSLGTISKLERRAAEVLEPVVAEVAAAIKAAPSAHAVQ